MLVKDIILLLSNPEMCDKWKDDLKEMERNNPHVSIGAEDICRAGVRITLKHEELVEDMNGLKRKGSMTSEETMEKAKQLMEEVTPHNPLAHTTDPNDPRLGHGIDEQPIKQHEVYLVLSEEERKKGYVRPVRRSYIHVGTSGPKYPLRELVDDELADTFSHFEEYPEDSPERINGRVGKYWTKAQLEKVGKGCNSITTMGQAIAETYARNPHFYGSTYCCHCGMHLAIDEFVWVDKDGQQTGQRVGS